MAGVAGPMLRRSRRSGAKFLAGLAVGGALAGLMLAVPAYVLGVLLRSVLPEPVRVWLVVAAAVAFAVADMLNRTPHVWRQVPQELVHRLPPGTLGVTWGFDLGLLFTTQKTTSLIWAAMGAVVLLRPDVGAALLVALSLIVSVAVTAWSMSDRAMGLLGSGKDHRWARTLRRTSGAGLLLAAAAWALAWAA
ncbi:hypothetical protein [Actinomadura sp. K4S16]|uniref:hypothetical protein n=1 Tax=Actinomadura sp. K4S16 TaxID=1316147 RepID=UPI0011EE7638|nr:hypothetical protein [Actinomadura sp. K4S16]